MPRPTSRKKAPLSKALIELRKRLGLSQQAFSNAIGLSLATVARWETAVPPRGPSLRDLRDFAKEKGFLDLAQEFHDSLEQLPEEAVATLDSYFLDVDDWDGIRDLLLEVGEFLDTHPNKKKREEAKLKLMKATRHFRRIVARKDQQIRRGGI